jgi:hypothetical protein
MERIKKNEKIKTFYRLMSAFYFKRNVREDTITFIKTFIQVGKYGGAHYASKKFYTYFGFSLKIFWYHGIATLLKVFSLMHSFIERVFKLLVKHKKTIGQNFNAEEMESYHNYGKKLSSNIKS